LKTYDKQLLCEALYTATVSSAVGADDELQPYLYELAADAIVSWGVGRAYLYNQLEGSQDVFTAMSVLELQKLTSWYRDTIYYDLVREFRREGCFRATHQKVQKVIDARCARIPEVQRKVDVRQPAKRVTYQARRDTLALVRGLLRDPRKDGYGDCSYEIAMGGNPVLHTLDPNTIYYLAEDGYAVH